VLVLLAVAIGLVSMFLFSITLWRDYWEYLIFPKEKAADNYIYPQLRYTVFDVALLLWCLDGFVACRSGMIPGSAGSKSKTLSLLWTKNRGWIGARS
jgi:hypothetical protein